MSAQLDVSRVTRFEVIDHTQGTRAQVHVNPGIPRSVVAYGVQVKLSLQDDGRTLKVFLGDALELEREA